MHVELTIQIVLQVRKYVTITTKYVLVETRKPVYWRLHHKHQQIVFGLEVPVVLIILQILTLVIVFLAILVKLEYRATCFVIIQVAVKT